MMAVNVAQVTGLAPLLSWSGLPGWARMMPFGPCCGSLVTGAGAHRALPDAPRIG